MENYKRKIFKTPRLLMADAYTVGSDLFQSKKAKEQSTYYITFRRNLVDINKDLYTKDDNRIIFAGLTKIIDSLLYDPITHEEIDETLSFLKDFRVGGMVYHFNEDMWRRIVDEYSGRIPIQIEAFPEGSVVYPNEPVVQITNQVMGFGELAAWFESKLLQVWAYSERTTQNHHWFVWLRENVIKKVNPSYTIEEANFFTSLMLTDFGDRAGICQQESEDLAMYHLISFPGTDTCSAAYQAWKSTGQQFGSSVKALAHRNVQAFDLEEDCYKTLYEVADNGEFLSMVADCYDFEYSVENYLLNLAKRSKEEDNGKIIVARPDSGDAKKQVLWLCDLAVQNGLYDTLETETGNWKSLTYLKFIEGDGMTFKMMKEIILELMNNNFAPHLCGLFGVGGGLRNSLKRDNLSAKYALSSIGADHQGVCKFSSNPAKTTLPGPFKVTRDEESLKNKCTIKHISEEGSSALKMYYSGINKDHAFGDIMNETLIDWKNRVFSEFDNMPKTLERENNNYPATDMLLKMREELLNTYVKH